MNALHTDIPVSLRVAGRDVLVVGGGPVAARKAQALIDAGAHVTIVAPNISAEAAALEARIEQRPYRRGEVADYWFVVTAVDDRAVTAAVAADAEAARVWLNAADDPQHCSVTLPAVLRRGAVSVAVGTSGEAPALASWVRDRIAEVIGSEYATVVEQLGAQRRAIHAEGQSTEGIDWRPIIDLLVADAGAARVGAAEGVRS